MSMPTYTTVEEQVEYGLDAIDPSRTITISLRDLLYVHQVLGELIRFFHQRSHYPTIEAVEHYLGTVENGAFHVLGLAYYHRFRDVWPEDIQVAFDEGGFQNPNKPYYYKPLMPSTPDTE
jgi:hypothetical protein